MSGKEETSKNHKNPENLKEKSFDELINDYIDITVNLNSSREILKWTNERLEQRTRDFLKDKKELEKLHNEIWQSIDEFCDSVWIFSAHHDFSRFISDYLNSLLPQDSVKAKEDPKKMEFLMYQIKVLNEEIKNLRDSIKGLDDPGVMKAEEKIQIHFEGNNEKCKIKGITKKLPLQENRKKVIFKEEKHEKTFKFLVKKKSKIYEKFEKENC